MSAFKTPVGPQPNSVYWRRRLIVGLGALVVIIVIVLIVVRPGSGAPTETATPVDTATTPADTSTTTTAPLADGACNPAAISVIPITDAAGYAEGSNPLLSLSVTNTGVEPCTINSGSDVQEYVITSGEERIWSSKDCQVSPVSSTTELQPGVAVTTAPFAWNRTRSDAAACDAERDQVTAAGASYHLNVILDGVESVDSKQFILN